MNDFDLFVQRLDPRLPPLQLALEPVIVSHRFDSRLHARRHVEERHHEARLALDVPLFQLAR
jgi:hypothetical protein